MQIKKTVGFGSNAYGERKGYDIHTECGEVFKAVPLGSQRYQCNGVTYKTLSAIKKDIIDGNLSDDESPEEPAEASTANGADTWDCVHPCALLAHLYSLGLLGELGYKHKGIKAAYNETLDAYGWLDVVGRPDVARAEREIERMENLKKSRE